MNLFTYIICMELAIHSIIKIDGRFVSELPILKRNEPSSLTEKEKAFQPFVEVMKMSVAALDTTLKQEFYRILESLHKEDREFIEIVMAGKALATLGSCEHLKKPMQWYKTYFESVIVPLIDMQYEVNLSYINKKDEELFETAIKQAITNTQELCKMLGK